MSAERAPRRALITGASAGLGEAVALACASEGWQLALGARRQDRLDDVARRAREAGAEVYAGPLDVGDEDSVERFFEASEAAIGVADVIVNNAGLSKPGLLHERAAADIRSEVETNLLGLLFVTRRGVAALVEHEMRGDVVFMGSDAATNPRPGQATYSATKGALEVLCTSLARELEGTGVRVTRLRLGPTVSEFAAEWDLSPEVLERRTEYFRRFGLRDARHYGSLMPAEEVARAILFAVERPPGVVIDTIDMYPEAPMGTAITRLR
ncbi:MAG: SDR family NAD(P)-dependent oxidoreductase [Myxococcota bacterium]|nr:SDR family NAD(P)-dependent oxidoreductase [Myxococcota bacterium]